MEPTLQPCLNYPVLEIYVAHLVTPRYLESNLFLQMRNLFLFQGDFFLLLLYVLQRAIRGPTAVDLFFLFSYLFSCANDCRLVFIIFCQLVKQFLPLFKSVLKGFMHAVIWVAV
jgi:hypothetical protein